jgi:hypothetical protein
MPRAEYDTKQESWQKPRLTEEAGAERANIDRTSGKASTGNRLPMPTADDSDRRLTGTVAVPKEYLGRIHAYLHKESKELRMGIRKMAQEAEQVVPEAGLEMPFSRGWDHLPIQDFFLRTGYFILSSHIRTLCPPSTCISSPDSRKSFPFYAYHGLCMNAIDVGIMKILFKIVQAKHNQ